MEKQIAVIIGSLRKASYNRKIANQLIAMADSSLKMEIVEIGDLVHYNEDLDTDNPPEPWTTFRQKIKDADGILFVSPEYNRTIPGVIKNAIDIGSRPYGKSVWDGKPAAVVTASPSSIGAFGANHVLRQSMVFLNVFMMQQPEAYIGQVHKLFEDDNTLVPDTKSFLMSFLTAFREWVNKF